MIEGLTVGQWLDHLKQHPIPELEDVELDEDALETAAGGSELCYKFFSPCIVV
ncbi:MAG: hypothetical protein IJR19_03285 [Lachnospiraceae bacterium]|nr:hypothetical protein [Lachnospiraceae bacterium]